ncbi:hypothetical protein PBY51_017467 [Eleginops maclovinus]|uniref:Uncharacterized protein n=1 Tax=Eleginops maclovinus TaxID=56733 RepID=A0AAN8AMT2_ELEMC|nr:hypothetical protein PBY51_017467 [Eleginops maclovinus]
MACCITPLFLARFLNSCVPTLSTISSFWENGSLKQQSVGERTDILKFKDLDSMWISMEEPVNDTLLVTGKMRM